MTVRQFGKVMRLRRCDAFQRRQRLLQCCDQRLRLIEFMVFQSRALLGDVKRGRLLGPELPEFNAEAIEVARKSARSGLWPGAAQDGEFEHLDGALVSAICVA